MTSGPERPRPVRLAPRCRLGHVAERVGALVAIGCRVRRAADADAVEDEQVRAGHDRPSLRGWAVGRAVGSGPVICAPRPSPSTPPAPIPALRPS